MKPRKRLVSSIGFRLAIVTLAIGMFGSALDATFARTRPAATKGALDEAQVIALQKRFQKASVAADLPALSALMTDNATVIHGNGLVQTKAEYINSITSGKMKFTSYELKNAKVVFFKDGAVLVGVADLGLASSHGAPHKLHLRVSSVWLRKLDGWQLILSQDTPLGAS